MLLLSFPICIVSNKRPPPPPPPPFPSTIVTAQFSLASVTARRSTAVGVQITNLTAALQRFVFLRLPALTARRSPRGQQGSLNKRPGTAAHHLPHLAAAARLVGGAVLVEQALPDVHQILLQAGKGDAGPRRRCAGRQAAANR